MILFILMLFPNLVSAAAFTVQPIVVVDSTMPAAVNVIGDSVSSPIYTAATQTGTWKSTVTVENFPSTQAVSQAGTWTSSVTIQSMSYNPSGNGSPHLYSEIYDSDENKTAQVTPIRELRVVSDYRLIGAVFNNGFFDYNFWSSGTVTSGQISVSEGSTLIYASSSTTGAANGSAVLHTLRVARFITGSANEFRAVIRITTGTPASGTNTMQWGVTDAVSPSTSVVQNGYYFKYSSGQFYVGYCKNGVFTDVSTNSFNSTVPTITPNFTRYQIVYTNLGASFYVNDVLVHKITPTDTSLTATVSFRACAQNINSSGSNYTGVIEARLMTVLRLGEPSTAPVKKYISAAGSYLLKFGPGFLDHITINDTGGVGTNVTIYDSTYAATGNIVGIVDSYKGSIGTLDYGVSLDNGLFVVPSGTFGNITVVYE